MMQAMPCLEEVGEELDCEFEWGKKIGVGAPDKRIHFYESCTYDGVEYFLYDSVYLYVENEPEPFIGKLVKMWELPNHKKKMKVIWFFRPCEIANYLDKTTHENEIFLASGEGKGLSNVNLLETLVGKCNVVCTSKDERNQQHSEEEIEIADYIFHRTFDVGKCKVSDKLPDEVAGIEIKYYLNWKRAWKHTIVPKFEENSKVKRKRSDLSPKVDTTEGVGSLMKDDKHRCIETPIAKELKNTNANGKKQYSAGNTISRSHSSSDKDEVKSDKVHINSVEVSPKLESIERDLCHSLATEGKFSESPVKTPKYKVKVRLTFKGRELGLPKEVKHGEEEGKASHKVGSLLTREIDIKTNEEAMEMTRKPDTVNSIMKTSPKKVKHGEEEQKASHKASSQLTKENDIKTNEQAMEMTQKTDTVSSIIKTPPLKVKHGEEEQKASHKAGSHLTRENDIKTNEQAMKITQKLDTVSSIIKRLLKKVNHGEEEPKVPHKAGSKDVKTNEQAMEMTQKLDSESSIIKPLDYEASVGHSVVREEGLLKEVKHGEEQRGHYAKEHSKKLATQKGIKTEDRGMEVTGKKDTGRSKWFKFRNEDKLQNAFERGTSVLFQNLNPSCSSSEVEDLVYEAFKEKCTVIVIPRTPSFSTYTGQAFAIFKSKEVAQMIISKLSCEYLMQENGRLLLAQKGATRVLETPGKFVGHLTVGLIPPRKRPEMRSAVSTSHFPQPNTLEYDMAVEWCQLQKVTDKCWEELNKDSREEVG